jgi:hypothetical protein
VPGTRLPRLQDEGCLRPEEAIWPTCATSPPASRPASGS